jgi:LPS-assembly protein
MKNNFLKNFLVILSFFIFDKVLLANEFTFNAKQITLSENGSIITATNGIATSLKDGNKIEAKSFEYNKKLSILTAGNAIASFKTNPIKISANIIKYDNNLSVISAYGNVKIVDVSQKILIKSEKITYNENSQTITSSEQSKITDKIGNIFTVKNFVYKINDLLIKIDEGHLIDAEKNVLKIDKAYLDLDLNRFIGKDISIDFNNQMLSEENQPRLKSKTIKSDLNITEYKKGVFTTCKKNDDCPPWEISAEKIKHDKSKKTIYYDNAWLKIYDVPVLYFPRFFHPDPTVKKQSGFLMPSIDSSNSIGTSFTLPYYHVISKNNDFTIKPRYFSKNKLLLQSEYRNVTESSENTFDFSLLGENDKSSKSHFFSNSRKKLYLKNFSESELNLQVQSTSNDTYLKTYRLKSPIINESNLLRSFVEVSGYSDDTSFNLGFSSFEDLNKINTDRFEFIYPSYSFSKTLDIDDSYNGNFTFNTSGFIKNYDTNIFEKVAINDLIFSSNPKINDFGVKNDYKVLFKNVNTDSINSIKYKNKRNHDLLSIFEYNSFFPLKKETEDYKNILTPKISFKYSPNKTENISKENKRLDINNIFNLNRISSSDTVEGGTSITYGLEFEKLINDRSFFESKIANVQRLKVDNNLPRNNNLGAKTSDIIGEINFYPNDIFNISYDFSIDENISDSNYEMINAEIKLNQFSTSFEYLNQNNSLVNNSYLSNRTEYKINNTKSFIYEGRENKTTGQVEFYNLIYQYENDCLRAAIEYNKNYYNDRDFKPEENIFFKVTLIPFGVATSPNIIK